jgi:hypothetical protein
MRYVTNEQQRRRTLFKPTLWAVASWLIFRVAHSLRIALDMLVVTASPARTALKISQLTDGGMPTARLYCIPDCKIIHVIPDAGRQRRKKSSTAW